MIAAGLDKLRCSLLGQKTKSALQKRMTRILPTWSPLPENFLMKGSRWHELLLRSPLEKSPLESSLLETSLLETSLLETSLLETSLLETSLPETSLLETSLLETSLPETSLPVE
jgi:hypothetical protein